MRGLIFGFIVLFHQYSYALTHSTPALESYFENTVLIQTFGQDSDGHLAPGYCVGSVLSPNLIITAAHCVTHSVILNDKNISIQVGRYKYVQKPNGQMVRAGYQNYLNHKTFMQIYVLNSLKKKLNSGNLNARVTPQEDLAVLQLKDALTLPVDFKFAQILPLKWAESVLRNVTEFIPTVVSVNYMATVTTTDTKRKAQLNQVRVIQQSYIESKSTPQVEEGDSGSPLYVRVGTNNYLLAVVKGNAKNVFSSWDLFALAAGNACFIAKESAAHLTSILCQ